MFRFNKDLSFSFHRIKVYELFCVLHNNKQLTVGFPLPVLGGFGALQARLHQPISRSGEEVGAEGFKKEIAAGLQSRRGAGLQGGTRQTEEKLHHTGST